MMVEEQTAGRPVARWSGADLQCAREALGLSMVQLADILHNPGTGGPWKQSRVSEAERGLRPVPDWVADQVAGLEQARDEMTGAMVDLVEGDPEAGLVVHVTDSSLWKARPELAHRVPAAVQRVAAALAAAEVEEETGKRPRIVAER
jgi:hypothetical protein